MSDIDRADFKRLVNRMSRAFRDSQGGGIVERFEAVSQLLFAKIVDERIVAGIWPHVSKAERPAFEWRSDDVARTVYERVRERWTCVTGGVNARILQQGSRASFSGDVEAVAAVVRILEPYTLDSIGLDVKGAAYEELLRDTFEKNDNQQYFTPRHLVDFVVGLAAPGPDSLICDPAVGSGGFLVGALNYVREHFDGRSPKVTGVDIDERMAWVARINVFLHGGDPAAIAHIPGAGSLSPHARIKQFLPKDGFTTILANPPFGSDMTDTEALKSFATGKGRSTRRRGVLFIERCIDLLRPGGTLAIVIDDSILNLDGNADVRRFIRQRTLIDAVISLPDVTFMPYSTAKSSVLVLTKRTGDGDRQRPVFMADVENVGNRPNGDPLYQDIPSADGERTLLSDLPDVLTAWNRYKKSGVDGTIQAGSAVVFMADIDTYADEPSGDRLDVNFFHPARQEAAEVLSHAIVPTYELGELFDFDNASISPADIYGDAAVSWIGLGDITAETGEYAVTQVRADRIKSSVHQYSPGDILLSKLRPKLRKVILIPELSGEGICSAELVVLRPKESPEAKIIPAYAVHLLRSDLSYGQQVYQITGVGRPRVGMSALKRLRLPVPSEADQRRMLRKLDLSFADYEEKQAAAAALRLEANMLLRGAYDYAVASVTSGSII